MKIAIYGDSFGCINTKWERDLPEKGISWVDILAENHSITNYARSGTGFMFSYEMFLNEHKNHDLNIVAVSSPDRIYVKALDGMHMFGVGWLDLQYEHVKKLPFYAKKDIHLEILKSLRVYMELWADWDMIRNTQHALVNNLWNLAPNTIVIPAFKDSIEQTTENLHEIAAHELLLFDKTSHDKFDFSQMDCRRKCHLSVENNKVLADLIISAMSTGKKFIEMKKEDVLLPTASNDFSYYVRQHEKK